MKTLLPLLIVGSLGLNLVLAGLLLAGRRAEPAPAPVATTASPAPAPAAPLVDAQTWASLQTADLPAMVKQLREAGFPPHLVRAIIAAQLRERYAERFKAIDPQAGSRPFWKSYSIDPKVRMAQTQFYRDLRDELRQLVGTEGDMEDSLRELSRGYRLESLPPDKRDGVRALLRSAEDARTQIYSTVMGTVSPEARSRLLALEQETQAALARLLSPGELEDYNLRNSDTSRRLRGTLGAFDPSEEEFRTIYRLQAEFDSRYPGSLGLMSPDEQQRRYQAQQELNQQIQATLGPTRGADYERANDYGYQRTYQLVARLNLPPETTSQVWAMQKDIQDKVVALNRTAGSMQERTTQLAALEAETQTRINTLLGPSGYEAYRQNAGGWLAMLRPPRAPTPPSPPPPPR